MNSNGHRKALAVATALLCLTSRAAYAQQQPVQPGPAPAALSGPENRPYDEKLLRIAELLGAVHFLRELCGGNDGQLWRERMKELMDAEGTSALRRSKLTRAFNSGYRGYSRTYGVCTASAQTAVTKLMAEAAETAENLVKTVP